MLRYKEESIRQALALLNQMEISGINNAVRLTMIANILNNPEGEKETEHGKVQET